MLEKIDLNVISISSYSSDFSGPSFTGGAEERQKDYARFLAAYHIITPASAPEKVGVKRIGENLFVHAVHSLNKLGFIRSAYVEACKIMAEEKIGCLICDNPHWSAIVGLALKAKYHIPLIIQSMAQMIDNPHYINERPENRIKNLVSKLSLKYCDLMRVSTQAEIDDFIAMGYPAEKFAYAPFYVDLEAVSACPADPALRADMLGGRFDRIVLNVSRLAKQKDLPAFLQAAAAVIRQRPKTLFIIIGGGPEEWPVKNLAKDLGLIDNIKFLGRVEYNRTLAYYQAADIFAITSIYEGTCMVLLEAAACNVPVVATAFAGARDLIEDGRNGFLAAIGDHSGLAEKILRLCENPELSRKMGAKNRSRAYAKFSKEQALAKYRDMFARMAGLASFAPADYDEFGGIRNSPSRRQMPARLEKNFRKGYTSAEKFLIQHVKRIGYLLDHNGFYRARAEKTPSVIRLGMTNRCSARCAYCPREYIHAGGTGYMDIELYRRIIDWASENRVQDLGFALWGEPLLHPRFLEMIDMAHAKNLKMRLSTNCIVMTEKIADKILEYPFHSIEISMDGWTDQEYLAGKGVDAKIQAMANALYLLRCAQEKGVKIMFNVHFVDAGNVSFLNKLKYIRFWTKQLAGLRYETSFCYEPHNWAGTRSDIALRLGSIDRLLSKFELKKPCLYLKGLVVNWNGDVIACTNNPWPEAVLGNIYDRSIEEIYNSPGRSAYLSAHELGTFNAPGCENCTVNSIYPLLYLKKRLVNMLAKALARL